MAEHLPVLLAQVIDGLALRHDGVYVDATFGRGGHSGAILQQLGENGRLLAIDRDEAAVDAALEKFGADPRFSIERAEFADIGEVVAAHGLAEKVDGVLFDFGVSSPQLDEAERGFSFLRDGPLDMRMDKRQKMTAADYIRTVSMGDLRRDIARLGEERLASRVAGAICTARDRAPIETTVALADIVEKAIPARVRAQSSRHPATKTFQAIRMVINAEVEQINAALASVIDVLAIGGRMCFLTFHSLEDRPVKKFLRAAAATDPVYRGLPNIPTHALGRIKLIGKSSVATDAELEQNPRARSARLRVAERVR